jgi:hypothetical protein
MVFRIVEKKHREKKNVRGETFKIQLRPALICSAWGFLFGFGMQAHTGPWSPLPPGWENLFSASHPSPLSPTHLNGVPEQWGPQ